MGLWMLRGSYGRSLIHPRWLSAE